MNVPVSPRSRLLSCFLLAAATLTVALACPAISVAVTAGRSQQRAARRAERAEERAARQSERAARRAKRAEEAAARRLARSEEREARVEARHNATETPGAESPQGSGAGSSSNEPGADAQAYRGCHLSLEVSAPRITAGETVTVSGKLLCPSGEEAGPRPVTLLERTGGQPLVSFASAAAPLTPEADGSFTMTTGPLSTNTVFQARAGRTRARAVVKVAPLVTLVAAPVAAQSAASSGSRPSARTLTAFTGTVSPAAAGARVALQVSYPGSEERWHTVAFAHVTAAGSYATYHAFRIPGRASVRAIVHMKANAVGTSETLALEGTQPQNPSLTIETSADPVAYGQPVTISGIAAGAAAQQVKLFARNAAGTFQLVDTTATEAGGAYKFTEQPLASTRYRVSTASQRSTILVEPVAFALSDLQTPAAATVGQPVAFSGTLGPARPGQPVYLERQYPSGVGFRVIATAAADSSSQFTIEHAFERAGSVVLRILVPAGGGEQATAGAPFTLAVADPPAVPAS